MRRGLRARALTGRLLVVASVVAATATAHAHGPAPAVLEVLAADTEGPIWLRASVGLLRRSPDGSWEHVCPALWDGNDRMQAAVAADRALVVSTTEGWRMPAEDRCEPWEAIGPVRFAAADGVDGALYWLSEDGAGSLSLWSEEGSLAAVPASVGSVTSMLAREGRVAVGAREGVALWEGGAWRAIPLPSRLRWVRALEGERLYGVAAIDGRSVPERTALGDGSVVLGPPATVVLGPVRLGATMRVVADGEWLEEQGEGWVPLGPASRPWTCLHALHGPGSAVYACSLEGLFELGAEGPLPAATAVFRFTQIGPSACAGCERDWAHYGGETGWLETAPATSPDGERRPLDGGGCGVAPDGPRPGRGAPWLPPLAAWLLVALRGPVGRRRRSARRRPADRPPTRR